MYKMITAGMLIGALFSGSVLARTVADEQLLELDRNRTSVDYYDSSEDRMDESYKTHILALMKVLEGHKWISDAEEVKQAGFTFKPKTDLKFNWNDPKVELGYFVEVERFHYGDPLTKRVHYAWQSPIDGYVNLQGWDERDFNLHIKVVSDTEIDVYFQTYASEERYRFYRVEEWRADPNPPKKLKSARESGTIF